MDREECLSSKIAESVYLIGTADERDRARMNVFLICRDGWGIVIDPGPRVLFRKVLRAATKIVPLDKITAIIVSHQDPDICSSLPLWEEEGFKGSLIMFARTCYHIRAYGLCSPVIVIEEDTPAITGKAGNYGFLSFSFDYSKNVLLTYDRETETLFSSKLFSDYSLGKALIPQDTVHSGLLACRRESALSFGDREFIPEYGEKWNIQRVCPARGHVLGIGSPEAASEPSEGDKTGFTPDFSHDDMDIDYITGLHNFAVFYRILPLFIGSNSRGTVAYFRIDALKSFNHSYGILEGNRAIATFSSILRASSPEDSLLFRESGPNIILLLPDAHGDSHMDAIESMQNRVRESREFIQEMTCSAAVLNLREIPENCRNKTDYIFKTIRTRLRQLDVKGVPNVISFSPDKEARDPDHREIMIIDSDPIAPKLLKDFLTLKDYTALIYRDGIEALERIEESPPDMIISEMLVPQMDGFRIRERLLQSMNHRSIPFLFLSHLRTEDSVRRAQKLGVYHNLEKPVMLTEIQGLVEAMIKTESLLW